MDIIEIAKQKDNILRPDYQVFCGQCGERYYSPFDKMFIEVNKDCIICTKISSDEINRLSDNINKILEVEK